eukprot:m51a1_g13220 putative transcription factor 25 (445) ;mRNA; f:155-1670
MSRLFGRRTVEAAKRGLVPRRTLGGNALLVRPPANWPPVASGLGPVMEQAGRAPDGALAFRYAWPPRYAEAQAEFEAAAASHDPQALGEVLADAPWHAETLLQLALVHLQFGEQTDAEAMLERALYAFQSGFHHMFSLRGTCRLDFDDPKNKTFFLVLFRYAAALARRGCCKTALEVAKLMIDLDPRDPLGGLLLIDYYAMRCAEHHFVLSLLTKEVAGQRLAMLPNVVYSAALAQRRLEEAEGRTDDEQGAAGLLSDSLLDRALMLFPTCVPLLLDKGGDAAGSKALAQQRFMLEAENSPRTPVALKRVISIYATRSAELWKGPAMSWLRRRATALCERVPPEAEGVAREMQEHWGSGVASSLYRHLLLSDFSDASIGNVPREIVEAVAGDGGYRAFDRPAQRVPAPVQNLLGLFLYTLVPWVPVPNAPHEPDNHNPPGAGGQ